jgi:hypothetical protein
MLTLKDLAEYAEKGFLRLRIDVYLNIAGKHIGGIVLDGEQIKKLVAGRLLIRKKVGKKFVTTNVAKEQNLSIDVERAPIMRYHRSRWEKIKAQMRGAGFSYRSESPWHGCYKQGRWTNLWGDPIRAQE